MRYIWRRTLLSVVGAALAAGSAIAEPDAAGLAAAVPVEVTEIVSGGSWVEGTASGSFRTVTIQSYVPAEVAEVWLQWIGSRSPAEPVQIISSVPLREFNDQKLTSASVTLDGETDGTARIMITGQDSDQRAAAALNFLATKPGLYEPVASAPAVNVRK